MDIKAKLFFKKEERILLKTNVNYERHTNSNGRPTTELLDGTISVSFEPQMYDDIFIESLLEHRLDINNSKDLNCYQKLYKPYDGKIVFYKDKDYEIELFQYNFKDAVIIELNEEFDSQIGMLVSMVISPAMQDYRFLKNSTKWDQLSPTRYIKHSWEESWVPPRKEKSNQQQENLTPRYKCYYTDLQGNKKAESTTGEEVYLVVESTNAIGKTIDIDLSDHTKDFIYNNKVIENDIIKDFNITSNEHKFKLLIVVQQEGERVRIKN